MTWRNDAGLVGNVAVVTGAAGGIGSAVARGFAEAGSKVFLVDIPSAPLAQTLQTLAGSGHQIFRATSPTSLAMQRSLIRQLSWARLSRWHTALRFFAGEPLSMMSLKKIGISR